MIASRYLLSEHSGPFVDREIAHLEISIVSSTYMGFTCFDSDLCDEDTTRCVLNGDVRLLEYVLSSWVKHVLEAYRCSKDPSRLNILSNLLEQNVLRKHFTQAAYQSVSLPQEGILSIKSTGIMPPEIKWALVKVLDYQKKLHQKLECSEGKITAIFHLASLCLTFMPDYRAQRLVRPERSNGHWKSPPEALQSLARPSRRGIRG